MGSLLMMIAILAAAPQKADDGDWVDVSLGGAEKVEISFRGITLTGPTNKDARVWTRVTEPDGYKTVSLFSVDCPAWEYRILSANRYNKAGERIDSAEVLEPAHIIPGSAADKLAGSICKP